MTTIEKPSGVTRIVRGSSVTVSGTGTVTCVMPLQDYIPSNPDKVVFWVDAGEILSDGSTVTRASDDVMDVDGDTAMDGIQRRSSPSPSLTLRRRAVTAPNTVGIIYDPTPVATIPTGALYAFGRQNGRSVLALGPQSTGFTYWLVTYANTCCGYPENGVPLRRQVHGR